MPTFKKRIFFGHVALFVGSISVADVPRTVNSGADAAVVSKPATGYWVVHQESNPRAFLSIQRLEKCKLKGPLLTTPGLRVPWEIYPKQSIDREEGTVTMQLVFDGDWCVRKATIVQSTGYWRLDNVSLEYVMTVKWMPKNLVVVDGEQSTTIQIGWGASQGKH